MPQPAAETDDTRAVVGGGGGGVAVKGELD